MEEQDRRKKSSAGVAIPEGSFVDAFSSVADPRVERNIQHLLLDIIVIAVCAVVYGADGWVDVAAYG